VVIPHRQQSSTEMKIKDEEKDKNMIKNQAQISLPSTRKQTSHTSLSQYHHLKTSQKG